MSNFFSFTIQAKVDAKSIQLPLEGWELLHYMYESLQILWVQVQIPADSFKKN